MKIAHVVVASGYIDGAGYQENILPAFHKLHGHEVWVISRKSVIGNGNEVLSVDSNIQYDYVDSNGLNITILRSNDTIINKIPILRIFTNRTIGLYDTICKIAPDVIFMHGLQSFDSLTVLRYVRNRPKVKLFVDQHIDYYNCPVITIKQKFIQRGIFGYVAKKLIPYTERFWGVTPWRVQYLQDVYKIPKNKTDLLVMGGDDRYIHWKDKDYIRTSLRNQYNIPKDAFLIVTGGKIDDMKNLQPLIYFMQKHYSENIFLLVFGCYDNKWEKIIQENSLYNIINIGWLDSTKVYDYFMTADLGCFLGTHSVLWEQLCASGTPGIFKDWNGGFSHIDVGGNALLVSDTSKDNVEKVLLGIIKNPEEYTSMKEVAETKAMKTFSYDNIARRSIIC